MHNYSTKAHQIFEKKAIFQHIETAIKDEAHISNIWWFY